MPQGWNIADSGVSPWQKRLFDSNGKMIAKIFLKPAGRCGSLHVFLTDDDPMAAPDVVPAFTAARSAPASVVSDGVRQFGLARRINDGGRDGSSSWVSSSSARATTSTTTSSCLPAGSCATRTTCSCRSSSTAPATRVAQLFFRPTGGTPSVHVIMDADDAQRYA